MQEFRQSFFPLLLASFYFAGTEVFPIAVDAAVVVIPAAVVIGQFEAPAEEAAAVDAVVELRPDAGLGLGKRRGTEKRRHLRDFVR